jgi:hypothetical protein
MKNSKWIGRLLFAILIGLLGLFNYRTTSLAQSPQPTIATTEEEITFQSGAVTLSGTFKPDHILPEIKHPTRAGSGLKFDRLGNRRQFFLRAHRRTVRGTQFHSRIGKNFDWHPMRVSRAFAPRVTDTRSAARRAGSSAVSNSGAAQGRGCLTDSFDIHSANHRARVRPFEIHPAASFRTPAIASDSAAE